MLVPSHFIFSISLSHTILCLRDRAETLLKGDDREIKKNDNKFCNCYFAGGESREMLNRKFLNCEINRRSFWANTDVEGCIIGANKSFICCVAYC